MTRAALYARFSSDRQNERSNEDQFALCRTWCAREGFAVVATFEDQAISGASMHNRAGLQGLLAAAAERLFDVVVVESMSRIGRDEEDRAAIRKRMAFHGIRIATPAEGFVSPLVDGIRAVIDSAYLDDLKRATRRGMAGNVRQGLSAGGIAYGYRIVRGEPGARAIDADEAEIVREIFRRLGSGERARAIAHDLNRRGIAPPRGRQWNATTINGNRARGIGIAVNEIYRGVLVWNKIAMIKDPAAKTGRRISRPNPSDQWLRHPVPALAIVTDAEFTAVQDALANRAHSPHAMRRAPKRILSGLLRCGACGSGMSIYDTDKAGRVRVRCTAHAESRTCPAPHSFRLETIEARTLGALRTEFRHPQVIAEYVRTYHAERQRLAGDSTRRRADIDRRLAEVARALARATDALLNGIGDAQEIDTRSKALRAEHDALTAERDALPAGRTVIALHPAALARFEAQVDTLENALGKPIAAGDVEAANAIRDLIQSVTVSPGDGYGGVQIDIAGRLAHLLNDPTRKAGGLSGSGGGI